MAPSDVEDPGAGQTAPSPDSRRGPTVATAHVADALDRFGLDRRSGPPALRPLVPGATLLGRVRGVHVTRGPEDTRSALRHVRPGEVLVVDDDGRRDGACLGDQIAADAALRGVAGCVLWGSHRDSDVLQRLGLPVFSLGAVPWRARGPRGRPDGEVRLGTTRVTDGDVIVADDDGVIVLPRADAAAVLDTACALATEEHDADARRHRTTIDALRTWPYPPPANGHAVQGSTIAPTGRVAS